MLDDLTKCIESIQDKIDRYGESLRKDETRTRNVLVDPLLRTLGWDVSDPGLVTVEFDAGHGRADYALLVDGNALVVIEAKRLGTFLDGKVENQVVSYATMNGVKYAVITDGRNWKMYDVFKTRPLAEKIVLNVDLSNELVPSSALRFLILWNSNLSTEGDVEVAGNPITHNARGRIDDNGPPSWDGWIDLQTYRSTEKWLSGMCPKRMRIWDGNEVSIGSWREMWMKCGSALYEGGYLKEQLLPYQPQRRVLISRDRSHLEGSHKRLYKLEESSNLVFYVNLSASSIVKKMHTLVEYCEADTSKLFLLMSS